MPPPPNLDHAGYGAGYRSHWVVLVCEPFSRGCHRCRRPCHFLPPSHPHLVTMRLRWFLGRGGNQWYCRIEHWLPTTQVCLQDISECKASRKEAQKHTRTVLPVCAHTLFAHACPYHPLSYTPTLSWAFHVIFAVSGAVGATIQFCFQVSHPISPSPNGTSHEYIPSLWPSTPLCPRLSFGATALELEVLVIYMHILIWPLPHHVVPP